MPRRTPWGSTIIYEAHVKGLTYLHPEIPVEIRGTYKALGHPVMINYLKQLGITALEIAAGGTICQRTTSATHGA